MHDEELGPVLLEGRGAWRSREPILCAGEYIAGDDVGESVLDSQLSEPDDFAACEFGEGWLTWEFVEMVGSDLVALGPPVWIRIGIVSEALTRECG